MSYTLLARSRPFVSRKMHCMPLRWPPNSWKFGWMADVLWSSILHFSRRNNEFMMVINANPGSRTQVEQAESILEVVAARHSSDSHIATIIYNNHICLCNLQQITIGACFALWDLGMSRIPRIGITSSISTSRTRLCLVYDIRIPFQSYWIYQLPLPLQGGQA